MTKTAIEWTGYTWNYITGCHQISPGCDHCYALTIAERFRGSKAFPHGFAIMMHPERLNFPKTLKKPSMIFVNSMSDWCLQEIPLDITKQAFKVMVETPHHTYQLLTKRANYMVQLVPTITTWIEEWTGSRVWPSHIWLGISVESFAQRGRIRFLRETPAQIKFISYEPALGPLLGADLSGIQWLIAGAESGKGARPMDEQWIRDIKDYCRRNGIAFFYKQRVDGRGHKISLPVLDNRIWNDYPVVPEIVTIPELL